ncbi:ankyrin repeat domain-containing protein SOWAHC-like [Penaeus japonicus]|uniref:ankyrin repeat domain-containing protein SOWAHC-like n=1 Tax=Penaeus japonicus TaxID=27405 RepID=UPI001C70FC2A|nr:ankyrin repeat domain-containing protein SOWAHC-like [Penaeus japonicus]
MTDEDVFVNSCRIVVGGSNGEGSADAVDNDNGGGGGGGGSTEDERKVSVREATQKFNRMASESQLISSRASSKSNRSSRSDRDDDDSSSIHSYGPEGQEWILAAAKSDFNEILRLLKIHPTLAKYKDIANGYTALHWAAKQGRVEVVKLLAGTHHVDVNARSNGGYTPLHIAAMYNRTEVFDLLVHYGADLNMRDYSGKKPRTYNTIASTVSHDTQKRIVQRRNSVKEAAGFLRIGSLNVKVRKTTEAFNNLLSREVESKLHRSWGSSDSIPDADKESKSMPPPKFGPIKKRKTKRDRDFVATRPVSAYPALAPTEETTSTSSTASTVPPINADSDSDSAYGFGSEWH